MAKRKDKPDYQNQLLDSQVTLSDTVVSNMNTSVNTLLTITILNFYFD